MNDHPLQYLLSDYLTACLHDFAAVRRYECEVKKSPCNTQTVVAHHDHPVGGANEVLLVAAKSLRVILFLIAFTVVHVLPYAQPVEQSYDQTLETTEDYGWSIGHRYY